jgi:hypothetical protein
MMKILAIVPIAILLAGCQTTDEVPLIQTRIEVVTPSPALYNCPTLKSWPNYNNLTDVQVAKIIVQLHKNNRACKNSINAIKKFLDESKAQLESKVELENIQPTE